MQHRERVRDLVLQSYAEEKDGSPRAIQDSPPSSTTLSHSQLTKAVFRLLHPLHVARPTDKQQPRKDLLYEGAHLRKREPWSLARSHPFALHEAIGDGADHHVVLPARIRASFEVVEPEFGLEVLVMLFDRAAMMRQSDELLERRGRWQRDQVVSAAPSWTEPALAEQPDFGSQASMSPVGGRGDADRREIRVPRRVGSVAPLDAPPGARRQRLAERPNADGVLI